MKKGAALIAIWALLCILPIAGASSDAPAFSSLREACDYIASQTAALPEEIRFSLPKETLLAPYPAVDDRGTIGRWDMEDAVWNLIYLFPEMYKLGYAILETETMAQVTLRPIYRFSSRCLTAIAEGRLSTLSAREWEALNKALMVAGIALEEGDLGKREEKAASLLCETIAFTDTIPAGAQEENDPRSGLCALLHGQANCQGYADAFSLVMNLCGFECRLVTGWTADGQAHVWNRVLTEPPHDADITLMDAEEGFDVRYLPMEESILQARRECALPEN
ncbi:MAG: transglutaminase domain-containing protein [Clostridia bacterium]|nr:transglutaminase domain-containing protein [Clostridia bacterium]